MLTLGPQAWHLQSDLSTVITVAGVEIEVLATPVRSEVVRRIQDGPEAGVLTRSQLVALSQMPELIAVPWREIDFQTRIELDSLPHGAIRVDPKTATRVWRPAVEIVAVCSVHQSWQRALPEVSMFATVAPRVLRLARWPSAIKELRVQAERLGVGAFVDAHPPTAVTRPPSRRRVSDDARRWEVAEAAYTALAAEAITTPMIGAAATEV